MTSDTSKRIPPAETLALLLGLVAMLACVAETIGSVVGRMIP